jgi:hypothetical protein
MAIVDAVLSLNAGERKGHRIKMGSPCRSARSRSGELGGARRGLVEKVDGLLNPREPLHSDLIVIGANNSGLRFTSASPFQAELRDLVKREVARQIAVLDEQLRALGVTPEN